MGTRKLTMLLVAAICVGTVGFSADASAAVQLSLKLQKGKTYYQRVMVDQRVGQTVMGQEQAVNYIIGLGQKLDVLDVDGQGNMQVRHTYIWSRFKQSGPMGEVDYDSSQPAAAAAGAEGFAALIGQSYVIKVSPKGKVLDVNGVEAMAESVQKKAGGMNVTSAESPLAFLLTKQGIQETEEGFLCCLSRRAGRGGGFLDRETGDQAGAGNDHGVEMDSAEAGGRSGDDRRSRLGEVRSELAASGRREHEDQGRCVRGRGRHGAGG